MNSYDPEQITFFAKTDARGQEVPFGIKAKDRTRHVYVIGKTGMGKSTLLENMAVQDIKNGNGLAFIDPHGQTAETLLQYIPEERAKDVLYFAPFDTDYPVSFNVMEDVGPERRHLVVSGLMSVFKKIWVDAWSARMEYILSNTLLALLEYPDSTLLGVNRMLSDKIYRKKVIDNITDPAVKSFWVDEFLNYNERYMQEAGDAIKNKIGQFTANPLIRNIIGQPKSSFDIRKIMDEQKILIMNLSKGLVGESNANLLGSMLTTRIYLAAMSRADLTQEQMKSMPNFYFYVDEFQSFANATFADILSEARKYKLNLTIAHQYIEQMEEEVRNAVFGNVGTTIAFRVGPFDAEVLESIFTPKFLAPDIVNLGFAQIYLTLMIDGIGSQPFSAVTLPPIETPAVNHKETVINISRKLYAHPRAGVEAMINAWHEDKGESPKNDKGKNGSFDNANSSNGNNRTNGNRKDNGATKSREGNGKRDTQPPLRKKDNDASKEKSQKSNEKNLDELRAVLKSIAGTSRKEESNADIQKTTKKSESEPTKVHTNDGNGIVAQVDKPVSEVAKQAVVPQQEKNQDSPLKSALAAALAGVETQSLKESARVTESKEVPTVHQQSNQNISPQVNQSASLSVPPAAAMPSAPASPADDPLSPKKLERMMRVTGNDRAPLA